MNAEILAVGTELLMGQIANTNAQYISKRLPYAGIGVYYHSVVGDNPARLKECLENAMKRSDVIILTGGLGPTQDDLTKETVSAILGRQLVLHEESLQKMKDFFARMKRTMTENNVKQAYIPKDSIIIKNRNGTAPGSIIEADGKVVIMLPGPPSEMKPMFEETVMPYFQEKMDIKIESRFLRIFGIGESLMEDRIIDLIEKQTNPTIAPYAKEGEVTLRITAQCGKDEDATALMAPVLDEIKSRLGDYIYSFDGEDLDQVAASLLTKKNLTISLAESCTGGLLASKLAAIPGISSVFDRGVVSYSNQSKVDHLGVSPETLNSYGAVSRETALEMAQGIRKVSGTDIGLSITGIAGPDGGTEEKPVGLVYIAIADKAGVLCKELRLWGERNRIRNVATLHALDIIRRNVLGLPIRE